MPGPKDEILYCDRCGISFLWSQEEQRSSDRTDRAPRLCPGCRHATPEAARERGLVKWYNVRKRYGFIVCAERPDLFVHGSQLHGVRRLQPGDLVEFDVGESEKGPVAEKIRLLQRASAAAESAANASS